MTRADSYRAEMAAAAHRLASPSVDVADASVDGVIVRYARYGSGTPVLVLHGSGGGWDQGVDWAQRRLASDRAAGGDTTAGFEVVSPSRFGYPGSPLPAGADVPRQAVVLAGLLDALGLDQVNVVGLSAGSVAALRLAADHPDRVHRLVLESPLLPLAGRAPLPPLPLVRLLSRAQYALWLTTRLPPVVKLAAGAPPKQLPPEHRAELAAINGTMFPLRPRRNGTVFDRAVTAPHILGDHLPLERITAPTLVVNAAHAMLAPHDDVVRFAARLPDVRIVEPRTGGHVLIGNVTPLRSEITQFLVTG